MYVVGIIIIHNEQILVCPCRGHWVPVRQVSGEEFLESVWGDCVLKSVCPNGLDAEIMSTGLLMGCSGLDRGGPGALFDLVHVAHCSFNLRC